MSTTNTTQSRAFLPTSAAVEVWSTITNDLYERGVPAETINAHMKADALKAAPGETSVVWLGRVLAAHAAALAADAAEDAAEDAR